MKPDPDSKVELEHKKAPKRKALSPRIIYPAGAYEERRHQFLGIKPEGINAVRTSLESGELEKWADLSSFMLQTDPHLKGVYETRLHSVAGAEFEILPGQSRNPQKQVWAEKAALFCRESLRLVRGLQRFFKNLLHAEGIGWAVGEHIWTRNEQGEWHSQPVVVFPRDVRFDRSWNVQLRTYDEFGSGQWLDVQAENPKKFIVHIPGGVGDSPQLSGDLLSVTWNWLFKRWALVAEQHGLEVFGNPKVIGILSENADPEAAEELFTALKNATFDQIGVARGDTKIEVIKAEATDVYRKAVEGQNQEITKGILGSTLNIEIGSIGSKAAAESQASTTITPRIEADGARLANTIEQQWLEPLLEFNSHLFGGVIPPTPEFRFKLVESEERAPLVGIVSLAVEKGVLKKNELRELMYLEPIEGGEELIPPEESGQGFSQEMDGKASSAPSKALDSTEGYGRVIHTKGGEYRAIDADGNSLGVCRTKREAVDLLNEHESGAPEEE